MAQLRLGNRSVDIINSSFPNLMLFTYSVANTKSTDFNNDRR